jgi:dTDP-4-dehydrorhamnose 3,5-epimerase
MAPPLYRQADVKAFPPRTPVVNGGTLRRQQLLGGPQSEGSDQVFESTPIPDLVVVRPPRYGDARGFFSEVWSRRAFEAEGLHYDWCQDNHSRSEAAGVLRGLHYQAPPSAQAKLVRCVAGRIWDVAVDMRPESAAYRQWFGLELSAENWAQLLVPRGFLHGFLTLTTGAEVVYKVDSPYDRARDGSVAWNDPELAIDWPLDGAPTLSEKDRAAPRLAEWTNPFAGDA